MTLGRAAAAEAIGTALLLAIVVGSGIMGERLAQGNAAVALLANAIATGAGLYVLIVIFGPVSGAHFNPVVSAVSVWEGDSSGHRLLSTCWRRLAARLRASPRRMRCSDCRSFKSQRMCDRRWVKASVKSSQLSVSCW